MKTFEHRKTDLTLPLAFSENEYSAMQTFWAAHRRGLGDIAEKLDIPQEITYLVSEINVGLGKNINSKGKLSSYPI